MVLTKWIRTGTREGAGVRDEYTFRYAMPSDIDAIARIHVAGWQENYRGMLPDEVIDSRTLDFRRNMWSNLIEEPRRVTLVADHCAGAVHGFASAFVLEEPHNGFHSFLQMLYVDESLKRGGIGRALLEATVRELLKAGRRNMALRTLRLNPGRGFYEHLGARLIPEGIDIDAGESDDVVYGFDDICKLL